jgi:hypothetical protein
MQKEKKERGSFTIEASLAFPVFLFGFLIILFLINIIRAETTIQYAVNQVAKEISHYYYIADRLGMANTDSSSIPEVDDTIDAISNFVGTVDEAGSQNISVDVADLDSILNAYDGVSVSIDKVNEAAGAIESNFQTLMENPEGIVKTFGGLLFKQVGNEIITRAIADPLCKSLIKKYIADGNTDSYLKKLGVQDGLNGLNFKASSFLSDQRSINVVVVYNVKINTFNLFGKEDVIFTMKQTASTAAWVRGKMPKIEEEEQASRWSNKDNFERGKTWISAIKNENSNYAVKGGKGIDLYNASNNEVTSIVSVNVFMTTYSSYDSEATNETTSSSDYTIKTSGLKKKLNEDAKKLIASLEKMPSEIEMDTGDMQAIDAKNAKKVLIVVIPEEAAQNEAMLKEINSIAKEIEKEKGITINITYREKALG